MTLRPNAEAELADAHDYYEAARAGKGAEFVARVGEALRLVAAHPRMHVEVQPDVRKAVLRPFPYTIFYTFDDDVVDVISVFHTSRDPAEWQRRI